MIPYLTRYRAKLVWGSLCVVLTNVTALTQPWILKYVVDNLRGEINTRKLALYGILIVGISLVEGTFRLLMRRVLIGVSRFIEYDLRNDFFAHLETLSLSFFHKTKTGDVMSRAVNDLSAVRMVLGPGIMYSMNTIITVSVAMALLFRISWKLTLLALIPLVAVSIFVKKFGASIHEKFEKIQEQFSDLSTKAQENLSGIRVVKAYAREESEIDTFRKASVEYLKRNISLIKVWGIFHPLLALLLGLSSVVLLWFGGRQVIEGSITLGEFVAFMGYLGMLTWPTIALGWVVNIFQRGAASMGRMNEIFDAVPEIRDEDGVHTVQTIEGDIEFRNLTFAYGESQKPVLKNINLKIKKGTTFAVVGRTGSGKSTLVSLIPRLYKVQPGSLLIDGMEIDRIPLQTLRSHIGFVPQETFLFSDTIEKNIAFGFSQHDNGSKRYSREDIERMAKISNIYEDVIDFPQRFETFVGERGITLSGGQKQRTALSRALLINPKILILDDALSSVDTYTEEKILNQLTHFMKGRTSIIISHRISTVKGADHIIVLEDGQIVEQGRHKELLALKGIYADLYQKQLLEEELASI